MGPSSTASGIGVVAAILTFVLPLAFWLTVLRPWRPKSRSNYALRFSLWPLVVLCSQLAGPFAREAFGVHSDYRMGIEGAIKGVLGLEMLLFPIFYGIGYWLSKNKEFHNGVSGRGAFQKLKILIIGLIDRRHLYKISQKIISDVSRDMDAYFDIYDGWSDNFGISDAKYCKLYKFRNGLVRILYIEDGSRSVEIGVFDGRGSCLYPPQNKRAPMRHGMHGPGYRFSIHEETKLLDAIKEVAVWCVERRDVVH